MLHCMNKCCIFAPIKVYLFLTSYLFMVKECASYYSWSALLVEQRQDISRVLPPPIQLFDNQRNERSLRSCGAIVTTGRLRKVRTLLLYPYSSC